MENLCACTHNMRNRPDCSITSLVAPGLPIAPLKLYTDEI